jgi:hypothetical protein
MMLPNYWLRRPNIELDSSALFSLNHLFETVMAAGNCIRIDYTLPIPKWQFLCYLADQPGVTLHGTGDPNIQVFEPRKSNDLTDFGAQTAVYAAGDGLWAMFFAILDRTLYPMATSNACVRLADEGGVVSEPFYVFSISQNSLHKQPWRNGSVYLLPSETFIYQPSLRFGPYEARIPQMASLSQVIPFARLDVTPEDFPFLKDIRGLDDARLEEYGRAMQTGAPWPE